MPQDWPTTDMSMANIKLAAAVDANTEPILIPPTPGLTHVYENNIAHGLPMISVTPSGAFIIKYHNAPDLPRSTEADYEGIDRGKFLSMLATLSKSRNVLEIGTLGAYSTIWFARAVKSNGGGKVTSIEIDPARREVAIANLRHAGVKVPEEVEVILGAALDVLPRLAKEIAEGVRVPFDFTFVDADWVSHWAYFDWGVKLSKGKGAVVYVDNVVRNMIKTGVVGNEKKDEDIEDLTQMAGNDSRVEAVVMQTVGAKDYDGFLMAVVK